MKEIKNSDYVTYNMQSLEDTDREVIKIIFKSNFINYMLNHKKYSDLTVKELREQYIQSIIGDIKALCVFANLDSSTMDLRGFVEANI